MGIRGQRKLCKERAEWKEISEKAKPTVDCMASKSKDCTQQLCSNSFGIEVRRQNLYIRFI